jgi:hypothetical protein
MNSMEVRGGTLLLSTRETDALYLISRIDGHVIWKLGGTHTSRSLKFVGPHGPLSGQHDARFLPDGTITAFDNALFSNHPPRAVRYRVDAKARTATVVEEVSDKKLAPGSFQYGSARKLPGGDWVVSWGGTSAVTEATPSGHRVFLLRFVDNLTSYRAVPLTGGAPSRAALRRGMDAMAGQ